MQRLRLIAATDVRRKLTCDGSFGHDVRDAVIRGPKPVKTRNMSFEERKEQESEGFRLWAKHFVGRISEAKGVIAL